LKYYKGFVPALLDLFPDIGLSPAKFKKAPRMKGEKRGGRERGEGGRGGGRGRRRRRGRWSERETGREN